MNALVVYYSRSGRTRSVAERIAKELNADIEEVRGVDKGRGFIRPLLGAILGRTPKIKDVKHSAADYDLVVVGTPVWGSKPVPVIEAYLSSVDLGTAKPAFFCTMGGGGDRKTFTKMEERLSNVCVIGRLSLNRQQLAEASAVDETVRSWIREVKTASETG